MFFMLLPPNAISLWYGDALGSYSTPFFLQRWGMFAPSPPVTNEHLQMRVRTSSPAGPVVGDWIDLTRGLQSSTWTRPVSWQIVRLRTINGVAGRNRNIRLLRDSVDELNPTIGDLNNERLFERLQRWLVLENFGPNRGVEAVQMRAVIEKMRPFSVVTGGLTVAERRKLGIDTPEQKKEQFLHPWVLVHE